MTEFLRSAASAPPLAAPGLSLVDQATFEAFTDLDPGEAHAQIVEALGGTRFSVTQIGASMLEIRFADTEATTAIDMATSARWLSDTLGCKVFVVTPPQAPALMSTPPPVPPALSTQIRRLAASQGTSLESAMQLDAAEAAARLRAQGAQSMLERAEAAFERLQGPGIDRTVQAEALARMRPVVEALAADETLEGAVGAQAVMEALVRLSGRPVMRVRTELEPQDVALLGAWEGQIAPRRADWFEFSDAVGRIDLELEDGVFTPIGTGILINDTSVLTNRHVMDWFARLMRTRTGAPQYGLFRSVSIIFDPDAQDASTRFDIVGVKTAGAFAIGRRMHMGKLDAAVLELSPNNGLAELPLAIPPRFAASVTGSQIIVSGYPLAPAENTGPGETSDPQEHRAFWDRLDALYGTEFGVQYLSPGEVMNAPGTVEFDPVGWAFTHDATTLGGNSGSIVMDLAGDISMVGLHFGGQSLAANYAHDYKEILRLGDRAFDTALLPGGSDG